MIWTRGLVASYRFEGNGNDESGSGFNLTVSGAPAYAAASFGQGLEQATSNSTKSATVANDLGIAGGSCTLSCRLKINTAPTLAQYHDLLYQMDAGTDVTNRIYYYNDGSLKIDWDRDKLGAGGNLVTETVDLGTSNAVTLGYTFDGATITAYRNAASKGTAAASGNGVAGGTDGFWVGVNANGIGNFSSALIDEIHVWNRALTVTDMQRIQLGLSPVL